MRKYYNRRPIYSARPQAGLGWPGIVLCCTLLIFAEGCKTFPDKGGMPETVSLNPRSSKSAGILALYSKGIIRHDRGDLEGAAELFLQALEMDPHSAKMVRDSIVSMRRKDRATIICTHNLAEAEMLADRISIIRRGEIVVQGTVEELKRKLLGTPIFELRLAGPVDGLEQFVGNWVTVEQRGPDWLRYRTPSEREINPMLLTRLSQAGHKVVTLSEVPRRLEEVYLQVVEKTSSIEEVRSS